MPEVATKTDIETLIEIIKIPVNPDYVILLNEKFPSTKNISFWVMLKSESGSIEGKLHFPEKKSAKLIIFEPGFPGDASSRLERLWLSKLLKEKYTVLALRHVGTIINGSYSNNYLNCPQKQSHAIKNNQTLLGDKPNYTLSDWLLEPYIALETLAPHFEEIILAGHSFGALASISSMIDFYKNFNKRFPKIKRFVSLAGGVGKVRCNEDPILTQWADYLKRKSVRERVDIGDSTINLHILKEAYHKIHKEVIIIPSATEFILISPWGDERNSRDELCPVTESLDVITSKGKGFLIIDKTQWGDNRTGRLAHDMDNLSSEYFHNLVSENWLPVSQISVINKVNKK